MLVSKEGRIASDAPSATRIRRKESTSSLGNESASDGASESKNLSQTKGLTLTARELSVLLGGEEHLEKARESWVALKNVDATDLVSISADTKSALSDSGDPGGSDDKSCAICWKAFGTIRNQKHRCRVLRRYVCDDCSTKRLIDKAGEHRVSDGQFLLAKGD
jgi:uncharacterized protein YlaI